MYFGRFFGIDEMMEQIEAVTTADVQELAQERAQEQAEGWSRQALSLQH